MAEDLTPTAVSGSLREAGFDFAPAQISVEPREDRWLARLPGDRLAWFPANSAGAHKLDRERRILGLISARCSFRVPQILYVSETGFDVRAMVPGWCDSFALRQRLMGDNAAARRLGAEVGRVLVEQHTRIHVADVAEWLASRPHWPEATDWVLSRVPQVIADGGLVRALHSLMQRYDAMCSEPGSPVLVHGDFGLHNIAVDPQTFALRGVFDYEGPCWADRHHDFRYLVLDIPGEGELEGAVEVYEEALGLHLDRWRIFLSNAACAAGFLAYRLGVPPEQKWCGRTLEQDVAWVRNSLKRCELA